MMAVNLGVEAGRGSWVVNAVDQSQFCQSIKDSVNGPSGNAGASLLNCLKDLIRRGVVVPLQQHLQHGGPLAGERRPSLMADFLKPLEALGNVRFHREVFYGN